MTIVAYTVPLGAQQSLELTQGEDYEFQLTYTDGAPLDLSDATAIQIAVKSRIGGIVFKRDYVGFASPGTPRFQILSTDTATMNETVYDMDVSYLDTNGYRTQLQALSSFTVLI